MTLLTPDGRFDRVAILRDARRLTMRRHGWIWNESGFDEARRAAARIVANLEKTSTKVWSAELAVSGACDSQIPSRYFAAPPFSGLGGLH